MSDERKKHTMSDTAEQQKALKAKQKKEKSVKSKELRYKRADEIYK